MSRLFFAVWVGLVAVSCSVMGDEPTYMNASYPSMHLVSMGGGYGYGCDGRGYGCDGRMACGMQMPCGGMCDRCRGYELCCPRLIPSIVNKLDCMLQWVFCDPCNMPCMRPMHCRRPVCCGCAWHGYMPRCGCEYHGGFEPGCGMGGNWSPVTPADPFRDDDLKTPPPTPTGERSAHSSSMSIYARPHVTMNRSHHEPKMTVDIESESEALPSTEIEVAVEKETELAVEDSDASMVRHASAERKVSEDRKSSKKAPKSTKQVSASESKSSSFPRNPLRDEN